MRQSTLFTKTLKEAPKDEVALNAVLLLRAGYIDKLMAGVYSFLPFGLRVLKKIEGIIREEMNTAGGQEILMPALHPLENYTKTGREKIDVLFHTESVTGNKLVFGQSHEEVFVPLVQKFIHSYRDLPLSVYQIQTKFRNELRAKSGIFRGREFIMKDMYSFHLTEEDFEAYYQKMIEAYRRVFERAGIADATFLTHASGGTFSRYTHEFQTLTEAGEDTIHLCARCRVAVNEEIREENPACPQCGGTEATVKKSLEVGNIFPLKTRFSDAFGLTVNDQGGAHTNVVMGCYGIGLTRLMGAIAELHHDEKGLRWPASVAPFDAHLIEIRSQNQESRSKDEAENLYRDLQDAGIEVLYDDRDDKTAGEKFADADLIGIPWRVVVSEKTAAQGKVELKMRDSEKVTLLASDELLKKLKM